MGAGRKDGATKLTPSLSGVGPTDWKTISPYGTVVVSWNGSTGADLSKTGCKNLTKIETGGDSAGIELTLSILGKEGKDESVNLLAPAERCFS
jgi:hypothetical protein